MEYVLLVLLVAVVLLLINGARYSPTAPATIVDMGLTVAEKQICAMVVRGYKNKEIATEMQCPEQELKNRLRRIYLKFGVNDRLELALHCVHNRAVSADPTYC